LILLLDALWVMLIAPIGFVQEGFRLWAWGGRKFRIAEGGTVGQYLPHVSWSFIWQFKGSVW